MSHSSNLRPQIEAPVKRDQAELVLSFYARRLAEALARRPGMTDPAQRMMLDHQIEVAAQHLRSSCETCRGLKVRQGVLDWQPGHNVQQLLEKAGAP